MKNLRLVSLPIMEVNVKYFYDVDTDCSGVIVYDLDDVRLGSIIGLDIPDENADAEVISNFEKEIEDWIFENV